MRAEILYTKHGEKGMRVFLFVGGGMLLLAAYIASPFFALYRIDNALRERDTITLERYADWPALREQLRSDLKGVVASQLSAPNNSGDPASSLGSSFIALLLPVVVDRVVDFNVSPDGLVRWLDQQHVLEADKHLRDVIRYAFFAGPTEFRVDLGNPGDPGSPPITSLMEFGGFGWRVTRIKLPLEALTKAAESSRQDVIKAAGKNTPARTIDGQVTDEQDTAAQAKPNLEQPAKLLPSQSENQPSPANASAEASTPKEPMAVIASDGDWLLRKDTDSFNDEVSCVIIYAKPPGPAIQVSPGSLYISYQGRGGLKAYRYRIDDGPASKLQLPTEVQKQMDVAEISGRAFDAIIASKRLRVEALTYVAGIVREDMNLVGLSALYEKMRTACPGNEATPAASPAVDPQAVAAIPPVAPQAARPMQYVVMVGSKQNQTAALATFADMQQKYPTLLRGYRPMVQKADLGAKGIWYRLRIGPINDKATALKLCTQLKSQGHPDCLVMAAQ
jgi:cell division protein FtsN